MKVQSTKLRINVNFDGRVKGGLAQEGAQLWSSAAEQSHPKKKNRLLTP